MMCHFGDEQRFTVAEAAEFLHKSKRWIWRSIWYGKLPAQKVGHDWRIRQGDLKGDLAAPGYHPKDREQATDE